MSESAGKVRVVMFSVVSQFVESLDRFLQERGHKLVGVVTAPGPRIRRTDEYRDVMQLARPGLDLIVSNYPDRWADLIRPLRPDVVFSTGFNWKIPGDVLEVPTLGALNGHDGFLPKLRGRNATGWALRTGDPGFGITFHRMTTEFDQGPIMAQRAIQIADDEDADDLLIHMIQVGEEVRNEAFDRLLEGFPGLPQDDAEATYAGGAFEPEWREIDWNDPVRDVFFKIRSWSGFRGVPRGAFGEIDGRRTLIIKAKPAIGAVESGNAAPGTVLFRDAESMLVQCADGPLRVMEWDDTPGAD